MKRVFERAEIFLRIFLLIWLPFISAGFQKAFGEEEPRFEVILEFQNAREQAYDTGHFSWIEKRRLETGVDEITRYELWALNGEYWRLETCKTKPAQPDVFADGRTIIVRPEGYATFQNTAFGKLGAMIDVGSRKDGKGSVFGSYPLLRADRFGKDYLKPIFQYGANDKELGLKVGKDSTGEWVVTYSGTHPEGEQKYKAILDGNDYRILSWEYTALGKEGNRKVIQTSIYHYDDSQKHTPVDVSETIESNFDVTYVESNLKLVDYSPSPPQIEMFGEPGYNYATGSQGNTWMRRMVLLAIGLTLIALYFGNRRRHKSRG